MEEEEALLAPEKLSSSSASRKPQIFGYDILTFIVIDIVFLADD